MEDIMANPDSKPFYKLIRQSQRCNFKQTETLIIDGKETRDPHIQRSGLAHYYEDLATPKENNNFDSEYYNQNKLNLDIITQLYKQEDNDEFEPFTDSEISAAVGKLNSGKSADEYGLSSEHLKMGKHILIPYITRIFNKIMISGEVPQAFKSGVITPVHKKGKDGKYMDNYRGITVTSIIGKLFEYSLLERITEINNNQSELQFGFTKGLSPNMAALLMSESITESKRENKPLYIATLDSQKAFDVVSHEILLNRLYDSGVQPHAWTVIKDMYYGLTSRIKWTGDLSEAFGISQGVRQGGILSTHLYKLYVNNLLLDLESYNLGKFIGSTYIGCPTCADDVLLIADSSSELQEMLSLAYTYSTESRYNIHPTKSAVVRRSVTKAQLSKESTTEFHLGQQIINTNELTQHLGMTRASHHENQHNIDERISLARRTLYKLMNTGVHGSNGINPKVGYKIYQVFVLPRLLHSLEVLPLNISQIKKLSDFHIGTLRKLQSLPQRTSSAAVYLLLGALPIEPELERRHLSLLYSILNSKNTKLNEIRVRQTSLPESVPHSFFTRCSQIIERYCLPSTDKIKFMSKNVWKQLVKKKVRNYWSTQLLDDVSTKTTMNFCCINELKIGHTHPVWDTVNSNLTDVRRAATKARMLTGTYILQTQTSKYSKVPIPNTCQLCHLEEEDLTHMLTRCPALTTARRETYNELKALLLSEIGPVSWHEHFHCQDTITKLLMDCRS